MSIFICIKYNKQLKTNVIKIMKKYNIRNYLAYKDDLKVFMPDEMPFNQYTRDQLIIKLFPDVNTFNKNKETINIPIFEIGEKVLALNLRDGTKWLRATVVEKLGINLYNVLVSDYDVVWKRHVNQLLRASDERDATPPVSNSQSHDKQIANETLYKPFSEIPRGRENESGDVVSQNVSNNNPNSLNVNNENDRNVPSRNTCETTTPNSTSRAGDCPLPRRSTRVRRPVDRFEP